MSDNSLGLVMISVQPYAPTTSIHPILKTNIHLLLNAKAQQVRILFPLVLLCRCTGVLPPCMFVHHLCAVPVEDRRGDPVGLELQRILNHISAGTPPLLSSERVANAPDH